MLSVRNIVVAALLWVVPAQGETLVTLAWPVDCTVGDTCAVQHYVDHGKGPVPEDYTCGTVTYKGHNGTDIRLLSMAAERAGVDVLAAAGGKVLRTRDGVADVSVRVTGKDSVRDRECGNGLVIAHAGGFETQYCHMAKGSLVVRPGDLVAAGQKLGHVGLSGDTEFPHLHITVLHNGKMIDPFAYGEPAGACGGGTSLWRSELQPQLRYRAGAVLNAGFSTHAVTMDEIENGAGRETLTPGSPAIVAFVRAIGLRKGDVQRLVVTGPIGVLADHSEPALEANKDQIFMDVGREAPADGWPEGKYTSSFSLIRDRQIVVEKTFSVQIAH